MCSKCDANVWILQKCEYINTYDITRINLECYYCKFKKHHYTSKSGSLSDMMYIVKIDTLYIKNTDYFSL